MFFIKALKKSLNLARMLQKRMSLEYGRIGCWASFQKPKHVFFWRNKNGKAEFYFLTDAAVSCQMTNV